MTSIQLNVSFSHKLPGCAKPGSSDPITIWNACLPAQGSNVTIRNGLGVPRTPISDEELWKHLVGLRGLCCISRAKGVYLSALLAGTEP